MAGTSLPSAGILARCGLGSVETLLQAFLRPYGIPPSRQYAPGPAP
jgi:AraC-like DNA-binding protein